jgi:hypothetical protein
MYVGDDLLALLKEERDEVRDSTETVHDRPLSVVPVPLPELIAEETGFQVRQNIIFSWAF